MYNILKQLATDNSYGFIYARRDYANLYDEVPTGQVQLFVDPVVITESFGEYNQVESREYSGSFMVLISSDIEKGDYEARYLGEIKPLLDVAMLAIKDGLKCNGNITINVWRTVEVINLFDYNMDGIVVTYTVEEDV